MNMASASEFREISFVLILNQSQFLEGGKVTCVSSGSAQTSEKERRLLIEAKCFVSRESES